MNKSFQFAKAAPGFGNALKSSIGFDKMLDLLSSTIGDVNSVSYPPHNILKIQDSFVVEIAAAGFAKEDLNVWLEDNFLVIRGEVKREEDSNVEVIHKGIAMRQFMKKFQLSENVKVTSVKFTDGLLRIVLDEKEKAAKEAIKLDIQ